MGRAPGLEDQTPREQAGEGGVGSNDPKLFSAAQVRRDERLSEDDFEIYEKVIISLSHTTPPPAARLFPSPFLLCPLCPLYPLTKLLPTYLYYCLATVARGARGGRWIQRLRRPAVRSL